MTKVTKFGKDFLAQKADEVRERLRQLDEEKKLLLQVLEVIGEPSTDTLSDLLETPATKPSTALVKPRPRGVQAKWYSLFKNEITTKVMGEYKLKELVKEAGPEAHSVSRALKRLEKEGLLTRTGTVQQGYVYSWDRREPYSGPKARPVRLNVSGVGPRASEVNRHMNGEVEVKRCTSQ